jgi:hypothetical protein
VAFALDANGKSQKDFDKAWLLAFRALSDLKRSFAALPKSVRIPVNANKTVTLPADYNAWSKIGVLNSHGEVCSLKVNNGLSIWRDNNPNRLTSLTPDVTDSMPLITNNPFYLNYYYNGVYGNLFGTGGGLIQYGACRVDERNNIILLEDNFQYDSVILEYISAPERDQDYMVEEALIYSKITLSY